MKIKILKDIYKNKTWFYKHDSEFFQEGIHILLRKKCARSDTVFSCSDDEVTFFESVGAVSVIQEYEGEFGTVSFQAKLSEDTIELLEFSIKPEEDGSIKLLEPELPGKYSEGLIQKYRSGNNAVSRDTMYADIGCLMNDMNKIIKYLQHEKQNNKKK